MVSVVPYAIDPDRTEVERVAVAFAPRADSPSSAQLTWVAPVVMSAAADDDEERLQQRLSSFDYGFGEQEEVVAVEDLLEHRRVVLVAGPGMGKTTLLDRLATSQSESASAIANLRDFAPAAPDDPVEHAIARLLRVERGGDALPIEVLEGSGAKMLLDASDEVDDAFSDSLIPAVTAAAERWPEHTWIIASRPRDAVAALREQGFEVFRIMGSRRWARAYLETRSVPPERVRRAMLDGYGLGGLMTIPLFAERLADRLLDDDPEPPLPLDLLVGEQYAATAREAKRGLQHKEDLGIWMRSLAVALELRGRVSAAVDELDALPGPAGLSGVAARKRLVDASLLADETDVVAFPRRPLQEGLCARAILDTADPSRRSSASP